MENMNILQLAKLYSLYAKRFGDRFPGADPARILTVLGLCKNSSTTQKELGELFDIRQTDANKLAHRLCGKGLVNITARAKDGTKKIVLLPAGRRAVAAFESDMNVEINQAEASAHPASRPTPTQPVENGATTSRPGRTPQVKPSTGSMRRRRPTSLDRP